MRVSVCFAALAFAVFLAGPAFAAETVHIGLVGDSIFEASYLPEANRPHTVLTAKLKETYPKQTVEVHNAAKGGATIPKYTAKEGAYDTRLKAKVPELDVCFIEFGVNDEDVSTPDEFSKNLASLCDRILTDYPGVKLVLCTSVKTKDRDWWKEQGADAEEPISKKHFSKIRQLAKDRGYPLVDMYAGMVDAAKKGDIDLQIRSQALSQKYYNKPILDNSKDEERKADGTKWFKDVHLNAHGVDLMAAWMTSALKSAYAEALPNDGKPGK